MKSKRELQKPKCKKQAHNSSPNNREANCKEKWRKPKKGTQKTQKNSEKLVANRKRKYLKLICKGGQQKAN